MRRRAAFELDARLPDHPVGLQKVRTAPRDPGHAVVGLGVRRDGLHVQAHPVDEGEARGQPIGVAPARVKTHLETHRLHGAHRLRERVVHRRFPSGENDAVQETLPAGEKLHHLVPARLGRVRPRLHPVVVAVDAAPGAPLDEHDRRKAAGKVDGGKGRDGGDPQGRRRHGVRHFTCRSRRRACAERRFLP